MISIQINPVRRTRRDGIVLLVTLIVLVALSGIAYMLVSRVGAERGRNQYLIDYQAARYACDSAVKYALTVLQDINVPALIERPNEPDFSDLFNLGDEQYMAYLAQWQQAAQADQQTKSPDELDLTGVSGQVNDINGTAGPGFYTGQAALAAVRGPYGPEWPCITEPAEFEIGSTKVRVEIEDENARYPVGWAMLADENVQREAWAGFRTFCEWMDINNVEADALAEQLDEVAKIKRFQMDFKPITMTERVSYTPRRTSARGRQSRTQTKVVNREIPAIVHTTDMARLLHSSLIDTDMLARPIVSSEYRKESALKYMGMWGSSRVNINTAPRHVLETAFIFGGDAVEIADEIIRRRRIQPFKDIDDLKKQLLSYSDSIRKCEPYITTASDFFTIKVTATSGVARSCATIATIKAGKKTQQIAVISG